MFGGRDDKVNLKEASLTAVQGFPEEANTKSIYDIVAELRSEDQRKERRAQKGVTSEYARSELTMTQYSAKESTSQMKKVASVREVNGLLENKGYESVPTKTLNRSEFAAQKSKSKHKSIIIQAPVNGGKPESSTADDAVTEKANTESPSKHRKIIRGFQHSKSTKVLPPNTVQLEKQIKPLTNNVTILTEMNEQNKQMDLMSQEKSGNHGNQMMATVSNGRLQSVEF